MSTNTPDAWVIMKMTGGLGEPTYKVLAGWYGGFAGLDSWRLNSGIVSIKDNEDHYIIKGYSGSEYVCYKSIERMSGLMASVYAQWQGSIDKENADIQINIVSIQDILHKM